MKGSRVHKDRKRSPNSNCRRQNRLDLGKLIYCQSNQRKMVRNKTQTLRHLPPTRPFLPSSTSLPSSLLGQQWVHLVALALSDMGEASHSFSQKTLMALSYQNLALQTQPTLRAKSSKERGQRFWPWGGEEGSAGAGCGTALPEPRAPAVPAQPSPAHHTRGWLQAPRPTVPRF